ncbi:p-loop containing nucleoside triphosphate hydrolase protein [Mycena kentingensis (nom. inval.)]|nr:p-loop containing nucleoside triphosphate hydrolase protein [Mycena kentingensis (nom. inval.)]
MLKSYTDDDDLLSGLPRFDQFLSGLTGKRRVLEISGERASGKTVGQDIAINSSPTTALQFLVLHLVLRYLVDTPSASVLWIDTTSDFSVSWAAEILSGLAGSEPSDALDRLQICQAFEVETVFQALDTVPTSNLSNTPSMRVVVIDTVTTLLSPLLSPMPQGHAIMTALMRQLRVVARNATVFVINDTVAVDAKQPKIRKPALGPSFTFMTDATLWLASVGDRGEDDGSTSHVVQLYRTKITVSS